MSGMIHRVTSSFTVSKTLAFLSGAPSGSPREACYLSYLAHSQEQVPSQAPAVFIFPDPRPASADDVTGELHAVGADGTSRMITSLGKNLLL